MAYTLITTLKNESDICRKIPNDEMRSHACRFH